MPQWLAAEMPRPALAGPDILRVLREQTRDVHDRLEQQPLLAALLSPALDRQRYRAVLAALHLFYCRIEPPLAAAAGQLLGSHPAGDYAYLPRAGLLAADLADLAPDASLPAAPADPLALPAFDPAGTLGVLYVLEGASQGGRVISRRLHASLGVTGAFGARYFNAHVGNDCWAAFRQWAAGLPPTGQWHDAVHGARATFEALRVHLDRCLATAA